MTIKISELVHHPYIKCQKCDILLARVPKHNKESISIDPDFQYYYRACECNTDDRRIIRVPLTFVGCEIVGTIR